MLAKEVAGRRRIATAYSVPRVANGHWATEKLAGDSLDANDLASLVEASRVHQGSQVLEQEFQSRGRWVDSCIRLAKLQKEGERVGERGLG